MAVTRFDPTRDLIYVPGFVWTVHGDPTLELAAADLEKLIDPDQRPTLDTLELEGVRVIGDLPRREGVELRVID